MTVRERTYVYLETKEPVEGAASKGVKTDDTWDVESDYTCIEVPSGTGENGPIAEGKYPAVKFRKTTAGNTKYYWYVRGIGKIREEGTGQIEQLVGFTLKKK